MPAVMRLNKLGTFSMAQLGQSKSAIASFMRQKKESGGFRRGHVEVGENFAEGFEVHFGDKAADARNFELFAILVGRFLGKLGELFC